MQSGVMCSCFPVVFLKYICKREIGVFSLFSDNKVCLVVRAIIYDDDFEVTEKGFSNTLDSIC